MYDRYLLVVNIVSEFELLDDFLVFEVDLVHLSGHVQLVLRAFLGQTHRTADVIELLILFGEQLQRENILPGDALLG